MSTQQPRLAEARVVDVDIADRMERSFLDYSMSVIVGRALPDVRDGLKPVQRRILFAMWEAGLRPGRPYRKCASAVGDVMKKYHPHGDTSIYEALVRMAQDFASREPLVDGHGNFGSVDGDAAAAMRYTEARLSAMAMELLDGIDEDTVDFVANYDGYETEPVVLPARFPNLLVNGSSGIAVGTATNIPPHNLGEVVDACLRLIEAPDTDLGGLMRHVRAPDFPTGARIVDTPGLREAYATGRGTVTVEAVATVERRSGGLPRIVVTELPYQVNKAALLARIADFVKQRRLEAVRDLRDESSRDGMRVVIELKRGEEPATVLGRLYQLTDLRTTWHVNMVALLADEATGRLQPRTIGLREALDQYLAHQRRVLTRRTTFRRDRAAARAHVLEGLLVALDHLDEVIALIRASATVDDARTGLVARFELSATQATAILDMPLRRLAALERRRLADEHAELVTLVAELERVLADPARLDALLTEELRALRARHATARRSTLVGADAGTAGPGAGAAPTRLAPQPVTVSITAAGFCRSVSSRAVSQPQARGRDPLVAVVRATTDDTLLLVAADGGGHRVPLADLPVTTGRQRGTALAQLLGGTGSAAPLVGAVALGDSLDLITVSERGQVKRTPAEDYRGRTRVMVAAGVRTGDALAAVTSAGAGDHLLVAHDGGQVIRFGVDELRATGRGAAGVAGLRVPAGHRVVAVSVAPAGVDDGEVVTLAPDGSGRRTSLDEFPPQGRGGKGVRSGAERLAWCGVATDLHVPSADGPVVLRPDGLARGRRTAALRPAIAAVTGPVVGEAVRR
ncbi:MAG: DNA topoisomerase 4 subunit A [Actinobacteria bacterium]|nr:DNA topoisomerase 4 subunit A [Actinomycetota bacterium]